MPKKLEELRPYLAKVKLWAVVAVVFATLVLGFYTLQGVRYWQAWKGINTMTIQIQHISAKLDQGPPETRKVAMELESQERQLRELRSSFDYPDLGQLMGILSTTAWETKVDLPALASGDPNIKELGEIRYQLQPLTLSVQGTTEGIYQFLARLHEKVPVVVAPNISISSPGAGASAQVQLVFYLSPRAISDDEGAD